MGRAAVRTSPCVSRLLRKKREELGLSVRAVERKLAEQGERFPAATLCRIEQGKLDPGVRRLHQLLRLYRIPPHLVADAIDLEEIADETPAVGELETLYREGVECWKQGNIARGMACFLAVREHVPADRESRILRQKATLAFTVAARRLGKLRLAREVLEELFCEPLDESLVVNGLIQAASVWGGLGSSVLATGALRQAESLLTPGDHQQRAWVLHQKAKTLLLTGQVDEASKSLDQSLAAYRVLGDTHGEGTARLLRIAVLEARGDATGELAAAEAALAFADSHDLPQLALMARLAVGRLQVRTGSGGPGLQALEEGLRQAVLLGDRHAEFIAHHHLWKAHQALGDRERARFELQAARYFVRFVDEASKDADEVRHITEEGGSHAEQGPRRRRFD
jgi:tetratricopeptide (TPR) repeat protein